MNKVSHNAYLYGANNYMTKEALSWSTFGRVGKWIGRNVSSKEMVAQNYAKKLFVSPDDTGRNMIASAKHIIDNPGSSKRQKWMAQRYLNKNQPIQQPAALPAGQPATPTAPPAAPAGQPATPKQVGTGYAGAFENPAEVSKAPETWGWDKNKHWTENIESGAKYFFGNNPKTTAAVGVGLAGASAYMAHKATQGAASHELKRTAIKWGAGALGGGAAVGIGAGMIGSNRNNS